MGVRILIFTITIYIFSLQRLYSQFELVPIWETLTNFDITLDPVNITSYFFTDENNVKWNLKHPKNDIRIISKKENNQQILLIYIGGKFWEKHYIRKIDNRVMSTINTVYYYFTDTSGNNIMTIETGGLNGANLSECKSDQYCGIWLNFNIINSMLMGCVYCYEVK